MNDLAVIGIAGLAGVIAGGLFVLAVQFWPSNARHSAFPSTRQPWIVRFAEGMRENVGPLVALELALAQLLAIREARQSWKAGQQ